MELCACILGQATDGYVREGGWRTQIPAGVFLLGDDEGGQKKDDVRLVAALPEGAPNSGEAPGPPQGPQQGEAIDPKLQQLWWQADAWAETTIDAPTFFLSFAYEALPLLIAGPLCWFMEGKASAQNRNLMPSWRAGCDHFMGVVAQGTFSTNSWILFILWLATQPEEVPAIDVAFPFLLLLWRASCISMKYAYFSPSDLERVRRSFHFTETRDSMRVLGAHKFFNMAGTLLYDQMEHLLKAALRIGMLEEAKAGYLTVPPLVAKQVWEQMKEELEPSKITTTLSKNLPKAIGWQSKYGDVQEILGLASVSAIDDQINAGKLPVVVAAYYFIRRSWQGGKRVGRVFFLLGSGFMLGFLHPLVLYASGKAAFGTSAAGNVVYALRTICVAQLLMPTFLYLLFPVLDSKARFQRSWSLISSFGRGEARAKRLCRGFKDPPFTIQSLSDLRAFWCLGRLLGPAYETGILIRYSSAFVAVHVTFLCVATASLFLASMHGEMSWGVSAELTVLFVAGSLSVVVASLFCVNINGQVPMYMGVARLAALRYPEIGGVAKDVCADFKEEHLVINPVQVMYIPATPALLSILWSGMMVLTGMFFSSLPSVCLPLFFNGGCSES